MEILLQDLKEISPLSREIRLRVTVVHLWEPSYKKIISSLEMVVADSQGCKIQASVPEELIHLFDGIFCRGHVCIMSSFKVVPNLGSFRVTNHAYRLIFQISTSVFVTECTLNPLNSLSLLNSSMICRHQNDCDFLADMIGMLIGVSQPDEYNIEGIIKKLIFLEFQDVSGKFKCVLSGISAVKFKDALAKVKGGRPVVVIRFAKIRIFLGDPYVENVEEVTQIFINPSITQLTEFKERLADHGIPMDAPVKLIRPLFRLYGAADFLLFHPKTTINELVSVIHDGMFVVSATLIEFVDGEDWWFPYATWKPVEENVSRLMGKRDAADNELHLIPRFEAKFKVCDDTDEAVFVMFDNDLSRLLKERCVDLVDGVQGKNSEVFPPQFQSLFGKNFLFLVKKESTSNPTLECPYRVRKVCDNPIVIDLFNTKNAKLDKEFFPLEGCECHARGT